MTKPRVVIIGGSLSGLFCANLFRTIGWDVDVFERSRSGLKGRGAGLGAQAGLFTVMERIGIRVDQSIWTEVRSHIGLDRRGRIICEVPVRELSTAWDRIYGALRNEISGERYHGGMTLERVEQNARYVLAVFADGSIAEADLLVAADGMRSTIRHQFMPEIEPRYCGYVAWRGVVEESQVTYSRRGIMLDRMAFYLPDDELAFSVPMARASGASCVRRCMFVWFRPAEYHSTLKQCCTDSSGRFHGTSIPPPLIRSELIDDLRQAACARLPPQLADLVVRVRDPILSPIFDLESPKLAFGRVALVGDAAFVARPHVGTGVTKAALDAQALVDAVGSAGADLPEALAVYERARRPAGEQLVERGRYLGSYVNGKKRPIEGLLREYGAGDIGDWPSNPSLRP
jgi:2-polyprenyl-6-methoxyphenol hydroxylase-like FAD-dependent oxidoreductase